ncbi:acyltransferase [Serratia marcescens]|uniref:acyltransferase family protein n=1 Tax=Serratia marcescens TaxID=615 RepID=UPI00315B0734
MQRNNIDQIQWLRGIAAFSVVFTHLTAKAYSVGMTDFSFTKGSIGVDIFFIISGFIMMYVCDRKEYNFLSFLENRAVRILPLHYLLLLPLVIVYLIKPGLINSTSSGTFVWESFFLIPVSEDGYEYLNPVVWTLCYEFLFYLIFSSFLFLKNIYLVSIGTVFSIVLIVTFGGCFSGSNPFVVGVTDSISLEFCYGVILYLLYKHNKLSCNPALFFIFSVVAYLVLAKLQLPRFIKDGIPSLFFFISIVNVRNLELKWLAFLGDISYEIYLCHIVVLSGIYVVLSKMNINILWIYYTLSLLTIIVVGYLMKSIISDRVSSKFKSVTKARRQSSPI